MESEIDQVGPRLRQARLDRGWTLEQVAKHTGLSVSTLSRLEAGKRQATLEVLLPIARYLKIRLDDLVPAEVPDPRVRTTAIERGGVLMVPLSAADSPVQTFRMTFPVVSEVPEPGTHGGYEWLFVLKGVLRLQVGHHDLELKPGEAAEFDTRFPHSLSASGSQPAEVISIFTEDGVREHTQR